MPLLQFDTDFAVPAAQADAFADAVTDHYVDAMDAERSYVAVSIRDDCHLSLGRAVEGPMAFCAADVRAGRDQATRREFAERVFGELQARFDVPAPNAKLVFTEHAGAQMQGAERVGDDWSLDES